MTVEKWYCRYDGTPLTPEPRARGRCPRCEYVEYDNPRPCVGFLLTDGERVLLSRRGIEPEKDKWDIPGGFMEERETGEEAVRRECAEETGLTPGKLVYLAALPDVYRDRAFQFPTLNLIYHVAAATGEMAPKDDVTELAWFPIDSPPEMAFPHQVRAIELLREYRRRIAG